ncbi:glycosyltransferase [Hymenobacter sp. HMF4947]|uniref:Glycosyltransferase n=1 Tax=Hymenobacter ginkgonis TaxID=2682976 RepID=A0A7K1TFP3_9BACT|nr:glycosyltransferase family 2 protein [Hymenobacter ginkgonis]MVN76981.1 glycosyltransferase [Hymenobacter ginkgonis]
MSYFIYLFWSAAAIVGYTYLGYAVVVWLWAKIVARTRRPLALQPFEPTVTLVVPAYNEASILEAKIANCTALDYPADKLKLLFITDGSTDHSGQVLARHPRIEHLHSPFRGGKSMAENRAMEFVTTPYVIFTDCNTNLNPAAVREMVKHYQDPKVGAVSGEKKIERTASTSGAGEGIYWKYESFLKRCDSNIYSLMGAAGELVSFRSHLFLPLESDTILDDFVQSLRIVHQGYRVVYEPKAYATEQPSVSLPDELERKIRICAGGWQAMSRLTALLNPLRQPVVTFLYVSHRVLRWSLAPLALTMLLLLSLVLAVRVGGFYWLALAAQVAFYLAAGREWQAASQGRSQPLFVVPLFFTLMNVAVFMGFWRFLRKAQPAAWAKASRLPEVLSTLSETA